ncbi:hypothetical protein ACWDFL_15700 [Streptomyces bungoensis]
MLVFVCAECGAPLTAPLSEVALPAHARQKYGNGIQLPVLMESGTFAVDPEPWGPPLRRWEEIGPGEPTARDIYPLVHALADGVPGAIVIAPGDARGTRLIPEKSSGACCGLDGADGPNMVCEACGLPVASRIDDCSLWQAVWLAPNAVRSLLIDAADAAPLSWEELMAEGTRTPPFEPVSTWGGRLGTSHYWSWSPQWEAAAGQVLAHLLAASRGGPVTVPGGLTEEVFQRTLDALLPAGSLERRAALAGPGMSAPDAGADIILVPSHPQTGQVWAPAGRAAAAYPVPLPFGMWLSLAFPQPYLAVPTPGAIPDGVLRDDPLPPRPRHLFRADWGTFQRTLVRLPAVRSPWLREILENLTPHMRTRLF